MLKKILAAFILILSSQYLGAITIEDNFIKDEKGNLTKVQEYKRIVVLDPAVIETLYMIGAEDRIVAIGTTAKSKIYPEDKTKDLPSVGNIVNISIEKVLSFSPDLVILTPMSSRTADNLKALNIPVLVNEVGTLDDILKNIVIYGKITGKEKEAEELYNMELKNLEDLRENISKNPLNLKGTLLYSTSPMMAFNEKSLPGQIFNLLGVKNIADNLTGDKPIISSEFLLKENPDFIAGSMAIKSSDDILNSNNIIKEVNAGKNKNIFIVDSTKILRGSPRIFEAINELYSELKTIKK
ncbi:ABC transporter substrate-binding protein [Fusobacterium sp.]|uniref:ABC transporter substrate-binding protein n=1 Tax=Fusobacterium sp. TaxID=68766 RepID=UPI00263A3B92|nr:ABC transporter substrate-binding protein [Fusobacterium sp.]